MSRVCPKCDEDFTGTFDVRLLRSKNCGHWVCCRCMVTYAGAKLGQSKTLTWVDKDQVLYCPLCGVAAGTECWRDCGEDDADLERETAIRGKVTSVLNFDRASFVTSPEYNKFLEEREDIIHDLLWSTDESLRKQRQEFLRQYEIENQEKILECVERRRQARVERIRDIVAKEGVFFEILQLPYQPGFIKRDTSKLVHPLQRANPQFFEQAAANGGDFASKNADDVDAALKGVALLNKIHAALPMTLQGKVTYGTTRHVEFIKQRDAGGFLKDTVYRRSRQEAFAGFRFDQ